jgi:DNA-binding SARP family transcriptional activator
LDALWPDEEGDAQRRAFGVMLHRLRILLGSPDAVKHAAGIVALNPRLCWVDAWAFVAAINADDLIRAHALYRGPFLPEEADSGWAIPQREKLRSRFVRSITLQGEAAEHAADFLGAINYYRRGIEIDPLVEAFYQGLMRCHHYLDQSAQVVNVYRQLCANLSSTLGVAPSRATDSLLRRLRPDEKVTQK